jgi:hypothetical protein
MKIDRRNTNIMNDSIEINEITMIEEDHPDINTNIKKNYTNPHLHRTKININAQRENPKLIDLMHHLMRNGDEER